MSKTPKKQKNFSSNTIESLHRYFVHLVLFPVRLYRKTKRKVGRALNYIALRSVDMGTLDEKYYFSGPSSAESWVRETAKNKRQLCAYLSHLARKCIMDDPERSARIAQEVADLDHRPFRNRWLAVILFDAGNIQRAASLISKEDIRLMAVREREKAAFIVGCSRLFENKVKVPESKATIKYNNKKTILYVVSSSLPFHVSGYTTRTHAILTALKKEGWFVICVTRPGYPEDRDDCVVKKHKSSVIVDGVEYISLEGPHRRKTALDFYIEKSADALTEYVKKVQPAIIHAASNYEAALPAMLASKKTGVPFVYEVRGLWEYTAASKRLGWEKTERFALDRQLESLTAVHAEHVLTLTNALAEELVERGVPKDNISLAPNAVDPDAFKSFPRDELLINQLGLKNYHFIIGYIGSLVNYEGLDDLIKAFQKLLYTGTNAALVIVGSGKSSEELKKLAHSLGIAQKVLFIGTVPHNTVPNYMSLLDVIALPRKPVKVCELVSPLKPLEAMATKVPMVVSSVAALAEMVVDRDTGLVHRAGDVDDLCEALKVLVDDPMLRSRLADNAYIDVIENRTWQKVVGEISFVYDRLIK